jgi:hypothetical protein
VNDGHSGVASKIVASGQQEKTVVVEVIYFNDPTTG